MRFQKLVASRSLSVLAIYGALAAPNSWTSFPAYCHIATYTIAFNDERCGEIDVHIYWDKWESTYEGLYLLKVSGTEWDVRFFVLSNGDELLTDRFLRIGMGNLHRSSYENPPRPFAEPNPQLITLV